MARLPYLFPLLHTIIRSYFINCLLPYLLQMCLFHQLVLFALTHQSPITMVKTCLVLLNLFLTVRTRINPPLSKGRRPAQPVMVKNIVDQRLNTVQVENLCQGQRCLQTCCRQVNWLCTFFDLSVLASIVSLSSLPSKKKALCPTCNGADHNRSTSKLCIKHRPLSSALFFFH